MIAGPLRHPSIGTSHGETRRDQAPLRICGMRKVSVPGLYDVPRPLLEIRFDLAIAPRVPQTFGQILEHAVRRHGV